MLSARDALRVQPRGRNESTTTVSEQRGATRRPGKQGAPRGGLSLRRYTFGTMKRAACHRAQGRFRRYANCSQTEKLAKRYKYDGRSYFSGAARSAVRARPRHARPMRPAGAIGGHGTATAIDADAAAHVATSASKACYLGRTKPPAGAAPCSSCSRAGANRAITSAATFSANSSTLYLRPTV